MAKKRRLGVTETFLGADSNKDVELVQIAGGDLGVQPYENIGHTDAARNHFRTEHDGEV
jgi:hypothetical protein